MKGNWLSRVGQNSHSNNQHQATEIGITGTWFAKTEPPGIQRNHQPSGGFTPTFHGRPEVSQKSR
ncbi:hypothetical protein K2X92_01170 [Candidatus Gracilibacteria bacterium]|nr:hypothetical protein [Candidatus Gracilibacteria bacterium]